jgi:hypothetical protein
MVQISFEEKVGSCLIAFLEGSPVFYVDVAFWEAATERKCQHFFVDVGFMEIVLVVEN